MTLNPRGSTSHIVIPTLISAKISTSGPYNCWPLFPRLSVFYLALGVHLVKSLKIFYLVENEWKSIDVAWVRPVTPHLALPSLFVQHHGPHETCARAGRTLVQAKIGPCWKKRYDTVPIVYTRAAWFGSFLRHTIFWLYWVITKPPLRGNCSIGSLRILARPFFVCYEKHKPNLKQPGQNP